MAWLAVLIILVGALIALMIMQVPHRNYASSGRGRKAQDANCRSGRTPCAVE